MKFLATSVAIAGLVTYVSAAATTVFPSAASSTTLSAPMSVSGTYDGGMKRFSRNSRNPPPYLCLAVQSANWKS